MTGVVAPPRARVAWAQVGAAVLALVVVLVLLMPQYGYHRDELYFRMLPPAWGYVDQPPLTPLLAHAAIALFGDSVIALRIVALLCAAGSLPLLALVTREVGGGRAAQSITVWGMAGTTMTLLFGHVLFTASLDLVVWPAALLFVIRAVLREDGRWWLAAGAVVGASSFNKLLVVVLLVGVAAGLAICGPRRWFRSGWLYAGVAVVAALALPSIVYQATHGWPQLAMGAALSADNAGEVRVMMWPFLVLLVGPVLAPFWALALVRVFRHAPWHPLRFLTVVFAVVVAFVFAAGTQFYYTFGVLGVLVALGAAPVATWARTRGRRVAIGVLLAVNALGCAITSLPLLPVTWFGASGLAAINSASADQVGWETYVEQISDVALSHDADAIIASNYGEAGALDRFGEGLPPVVSGHNALWDLGPPPETARTVVVVGGQLDRVADLFASCEVVARLDDGVGVDNEEHGEPIAVCTDPTGPWSQLWPLFRHLD
ncbi:glycosyltransferase family 39 protein [Cnuibacter physcomitrellae]|uniref:glycosyltransferase family 39 protein n=1 Tax=Cnuibacter physcomitrellae TaxID=1619308 RepID=UPI0021760E16|nr:glycosyltransferase family 39 protein [Cnuibacter physcomitrellae]MCS5497782.1 glycosyltransferase family 39 protein [Cnuibacter physcomitrellae]